MFKRIVMPLIAFAVMVCGVASAAEFGTRDESVALTKKAVEFYKANGKDALVAELNKSQNQFIDRDMYVSAANAEDGIRLAHPFKPELVGKSAYDAKDVDGKAYGEEMMEVATGAGEGWVTYKFTNPTTGKIGEKETYVLKVDDMILYCGVYKN